MNETARKRVVLLGCFLLAGLLAATVHAEWGDHWPPWFKNLEGETPGQPALKLEIVGQPVAGHTLAAFVWTDVVGADTLLLISPPQSVPAPVNGGICWTVPLALALPAQTNDYGVASWVFPLWADAAPCNVQAMMRIGNASFLSNGVAVRP